MTLLIDCSHLPINYSNLTDGKKRSNLISILVNFLSAQCNKKLPEILGVLRHLLRTQECLLGQKVDKLERRAEYLMTLK